MDSDTGNNQLYTNLNLVDFYDLENPWAADFDFCKNLAKNAQSILDIGCGTGEFLANIAGNKILTGVDPAKAMLDIAQQRPNSTSVNWLQADARNFQLNQKFDLIIFTGHTFQVFLSEQDQLAVLKTIAKHLSPNGKFIFDSRNVDVINWENWNHPNSQKTTNHPRFGLYNIWTSTEYNPQNQIATYTKHYKNLSSGQVTSVDSKIKFTPKDQLKTLIQNAGLKVDMWYGDWHGNSCDQNSIDFIPYGGLADI